MKNNNLKMQKDTNARRLIMGGIVFCSLSLGMFINNSKSYTAFADSMNSSNDNVNRNNNSKNTNVLNTKNNQTNSNNSDSDSSIKNNVTLQRNNENTQSRESNLNNNITIKNQTNKELDDSTDSKNPIYESKIESSKTPLEDLSRHGRSQIVSTSPETDTGSLKPDDTAKDKATINGNWGTAAWNYNNADNTVNIDGGNIDNINNAPWKNNNEINNNVKTIKFNNKVLLPEDSSGMFYNLPNLESIQNMNNIDTSNVKNMGSMFSDSKKLDNIDVSSWNSKNLNNTSYMFFSCNSLSNLNVGGKFGKNTGNVNDMSYMFNGLISMYKISGLEDLNTSSVVNMDHMFNGDYNLQEVDVSNFNTNKVTNMQNMFSYNISLNKLNLSSFDTSSVQNMNDMLSYTLGVLVSDEKGNLFYAPGIQTLMLGSKTTLYPEVSLAEIIPKDVNNASNKYSGKWQYIQNNLPSGPIYSSSSLTNSKFMQPGTYVWQKDNTNINAKDSEIIYGPKMNWNAADNFINATNMYGDPVDLSKISINGNVDNKPGVYNISYNYINAAGENVQKTINVKVLMSKANLNLKNTIITQGSTFNKNDNIIDVYDMYGKKTNNYNITLDGNVDTHKIGQYNLVYNYTDEAGNVISKNALVTVVKSSNTDENSNTDIITPNNINFKVMKKYPKYDELFKYYNVSYAPNSVDFMLDNGQILSEKYYKRVYQQNNVKKIKIIFKKGIYSYRNIHFNENNRARLIKFGTILRVYNIVHLNQDITRYDIGNGEFITTNNSFVEVE